MFDHQVGLEPGQVADPVLLAVLGGGEVQVAEVQHLEGPLTGREDGQLRGPEREPAQLHERGVGEAGHRGGGAEARDPGGTGDGGRHCPRLPQ